MGGSARIGSLHAFLGLDSADFTNGMKKAGTGLDKFTKAAKVGFAAVAVAAAAAGAALAVAVKGSIDRADNLSKMAQRVGTTTEALSRLEWAAKLSDVSIEQLSTGMKKLSQNMLEVSQGRGAQAATAFQALGISVTDTEGLLRSSDEVFGDLADRLSRMPDSAEKTALAMNLLGRSGADMIPLLNSGKQGLADMANESDRLGNTLSTGTGKAAEQFNDSLTRMQAVYQGIVNQITQAVLPSLNSLIGTMASPEFAANAQQIAIAVVDSMKVIVDTVNTAVGAFNALRDAMSWANTHDLFGNEISQGNGAGKGFQKFNSQDEAKALIAGKLAAGDTGGPGADFYQGIFGAPKADVVASAQEVADAFVPVYENVGATKAAASDLKAVMAEGLGVFEATRTPAEAYAAEVARLNELLEKGAINQDTYNRAVLQAQDSFQTAAMAGNEMATTLSDGLANVFGSIITGSDNAMSAVESLVQALAKMAIMKGFEMLFGASFGGGGGFKIPGFANGTNNAPGGLALVGERGPELVNLPRGSQVIPNNELSGMGGGGRGDLNLYMSGLGLTQEQVSAAIADGLEQYDRFTAPKTINRVNSDPLARG